MRGGGVSEMGRLQSGGRLCKEHKKPGERLGRKSIDLPRDGRYNIEKLNPVSWIQNAKRERDLEKLTRARLRPIRDEVYLQIRKAIIRGTFKPGDKLQEEDLAEMLGTSRTPIREALRKLEVENLVIYYPHRGTVVSDVAVDEVEELYQVRTLIETFIAKRAALNATAEDIAQLRKILEDGRNCTDPEEILSNVELFNNTLFEISRADALVDLNRRIRYTLQRVLVNNHLNPERREQAYQEHCRIVDALEAHDSDLAQRYTLEHLTSSPKKLKKE